MNIMATRNTEVLRREDEIVIDLRDLSWALLKGSWLIGLLALIGVVFGVQKLHNHTPLYEAKMIVSPTSAESGMQLPTQIGVLSGLGLTVGGSAPVTLFDRLQQAFSSLELARRLQEKYDLMHVIFRGSWDEQSQTWLRPSGTQFEWRETYLSYLNQSTWREPSLETLARYIGGSVVVEQPKDSVFSEVTFQHPDPKFADFMLTTIYAEADNLLRDQDRKQVDERQAYLRGQLVTAELNDIRNMVLDLLGQEVRRGMLLESNLPYAARIIEPVRVSEQPVPPNMKFEIGWRVAFGIVLGIVLVTAFHLLRRR